MRIFLIGNSFSGNATQYLPALAEEAGIPLHIGRAEIGGCPLHLHWEGVSAHQQDPAQGLIYASESLQQRLADGPWDVVTLQQASMLSPHSATYRPYARQLHDFVASQCPQARIVMHQTWAYRVDSPHFGEKAAETPCQNAEEMWRLSRAAYHQIAGELDLPLIPNGDAFHAAATDETWGYRPDPAFDLERAVPPALPDQSHSLYGGYFWADGVLAIDPKHTSDAGAYLGALVWFGFLFGQPVRQVRFKPEAVPEEFAAFLRETAATTVENATRPFQP